MKIIATVRTKNEELNIGRFCDAYQWADEIIVADGGSTDKTLDIVRRYDNARIYHFTQRVWSTDKAVWGNPIHKHINFLIERAREHHADWIIFDDCDCVPNLKLQNDARKFLDKCVVSKIAKVCCIYIYGKDQYFDGFSRPNGMWTPRLWAWRSDEDVHAKEMNDWEIEMVIPKSPSLDLLPPFALLHYFYPTKEYMQKKLEFYRHETPELRDPLEYGGRLLPLEEWMNYE